MTKLHHGETVSKGLEILNSISDEDLVEDAYLVEVKVKQAEAYFSAAKEIRSWYEKNWEPEHSKERGEDGGEIVDIRDDVLVSD